MEHLQQTIILFDLDGTLTDSAEGVILSAQYMQEKMGIPKWEYEDLRFIVGPPLMATFQEDFGMDKTRAEQALLYFRERYSTVGLFENKLYDGIEDMLSVLRAKGKRLAVATSKKQASAIRILEHFGIAGYFEVIGGDDQDAKRDTKAKVIDYVLDTMKVDKKDVIMVGDRKFDIDGAHSLGIPCIGVLYGYGSETEFTAHRADYIVATPKDISDIF